MHKTEFPPSGPIRDRSDSARAATHSATNLPEQTLVLIADGLAVQTGIPRVELHSSISRSLGFEGLDELNKVMRSSDSDTRLAPLTTFRGAEAWSKRLARTLQVPVQTVRHVIAAARMKGLEACEICGPSRDDLWDDFMYVSAWQLEQNPDHVFATAGKRLETAAKKGDSRAMRALVEASEEATYSSPSKAAWAYERWANSGQPGCAEAALMLALDYESKSISCRSSRDIAAAAVQHPHLSSAHAFAMRASENLRIDPSADAELRAAIYAALGRIYADRGSAEYDLSRAVQSFAMVHHCPRSFYPWPDVAYQDSPVLGGAWWDISALRRILLEADEPSLFLDLIAPMLAAIEPGAALAFDTERADVDWGAASLISENLIAVADTWCDLADALPQLAPHQRKDAVLRTLAYEHDLRCVS
jgi:hypothetical protein